MQINEGSFYVKYLGTSNRDTLLWLDLSGTTYVYERMPGGPTIKEVAKSFEKMMSYAKAGGRALGWLKKNTLLRHKMPTSAAKSKMKESYSATSLIDLYMESIIEGGADPESRPDPDRLLDTYLSEARMNLVRIDIPIAGGLLSRRQIAFHIRDATRGRIDDKEALRMIAHGTLISLTDLELKELSRRGIYPKLY